MAGVALIVPDSATRKQETGTLWSAAGGNKEEWISCTLSRVQISDGYRVDTKEVIRAEGKVGNIEERSVAWKEKGKLRFIWGPVLGYPGFLCVFFLLTCFLDICLKEICLSGWIFAARC